MDRLESLGLRVIALESRNRADVKRTLALLGQLLGCRPKEPNRCGRTSAVTSALRRRACRPPCAASASTSRSTPRPTRRAPVHSSARRCKRLGLGNAIPRRARPVPEAEPGVRRANAARHRDGGAGERRRDAAATGVEHAARAAHRAEPAGSRAPPTTSSCARARGWVRRPPRSPTVWFACRHPGPDDLRRTAARAPRDGPGGRAAWRSPSPGWPRAAKGGRSPAPARARQRRRAADRRSTSVRRGRSAPGSPARCSVFRGAAAQGLFRNPLADPYLLGSASGAVLGVVLVLAAAGARWARRQRGDRRRHRPLRPGRGSLRRRAGGRAAHAVARARRAGDDASAAGGRGGGRPPRPRPAISSPPRRPMRSGASRPSCWGAPAFSAGAAARSWGSRWW